jgi:hypothetical protein
MFSMNIWMISWFITLMTSSFFLKMWKDINHMFDLFWTSLEKLDFMLNCRNVNSMKSKWNSLNIRWCMHGSS